MAVVVLLTADWTRVGGKSLNASAGDELLEGATATKKAPIVPGSGHDKVSLNKQMWQANQEH